MSSVFYREPGNAYPTATRGEGVFLYDGDGNEFLDMSGGAAVSSVGHGHPLVIEEIRKQTEQLAFAHTAFFTNNAQEELAERLTRRFAEDGARAWFTSGGSESNESALKIAWLYWRTHGKPDKTIVISRELSYHGGTLGVNSVSGTVFRRGPFERVLHDWPRIATCYPYRHMRDDEDEFAYGQRVAGELETAIQEAGADKVAAFIAEPVSGASMGAVPYVTGYLKEIRRICDQYEVLFISDEVMCGSGRCGDFYAHADEEIVPDMLSIAKGLGGGYQPIGAVVARDHVYDAIVNSPEGFAHGHTYIGHPVACSAAVGVQKALDDGLLETVHDKGARMRAILSERFADHPNVGDIRGKGLFGGIEFVIDRDTKETFSWSEGIPKKLWNAAMENRLICYPGAGTVGERDGAHILLAPPFVAEETHFEQLADKLEAMFKSVFGR